MLIVHKLYITKLCVATHVFHCKNIRQMFYYCRKKKIYIFIHGNQLNTSATEMTQFDLLFHFKNMRDINLGFKIKLMLT